MLSDKTEQMMRYRGKFQREKYPIIQVNPSDEGEVLEEKWRLWVEREQWKRYVCDQPFLTTHLLIGDIDLSSIATSERRRHR